MSIKIENPKQMVASIPAQLGFYPENSVVVIFLEDNKLSLTMRMDDHDALNGTELSERIMGMSSLHGFPAFAVVYFGPTSMFSKYEKIVGQLQMMSDMVEEAPVMIDGIYVAEDKSFMSVTCKDPDHKCSGIMKDEDFQSSELAAEMVLNGGAILKSREELSNEISLAKRKTKAYLEAEEFVIEMSGGAPSRAEYLWRAYDFATEVLSSIDPDEKSLIAVGIMIEDVKLRDGVVKFVSDMPDTRDIQSFTTSVLPKITGKRAVPMLTIAAIAAYLAGDGARSNVALDIAMEHDPKYGLAELVSTAVNSGFSPQMLRHALGGLSVEDCIGVPR
jgi:hypothetical protein